MKCKINKNTDNNITISKQDNLLKNINKKDNNEYFSSFCKKNDDNEIVDYKITEIE